MQKLRGIDGEYDSDSATSNRLAHRKTIHMLEKNRHKKRAIGTLDVAFKKRFLAFTGAPEGGGPAELFACQEWVAENPMEDFALENDHVSTSVGIRAYHY